MNEINTGGGGTVDGSVNTGGGGFSGRDTSKPQQNVSVNLDGDRNNPVTQLFDQLSEQVAELSQQVNDLSKVMIRLIVLIDGDPLYDNVGMRAQAKAGQESHRELASRVSSISWRATAALTIAIIEMIIVMVMLWRT